MFFVGQCDVDALMVLLVQEMIYTCDPGEDSERQKKEVMVVSEVSDEADADPGETKVYDKLKLKIPRNLPPSGFPHCEFIDCSYFVHAVAKTAKINDDIVVKLPQPGRGGSGHPQPLPQNHFLHCPYLHFPHPHYCQLLPLHLRLILQSKLNC